MIAMWRTGNIIPTIIAGFAINYVAFSGLIELNLFH